MVPALLVRVRLLFWGIASLAVILGGVGLPSVALAEEQGSILTKYDLKLYGYVEASYVQNFNNPASKVNYNRVFDVDSNSVRPNLAQIVLEKEGKAGGSLKDAAGFRVKLDFGEDSQFIGGTDASDEVDFQETYVQFVTPIGNGLDLKIGRMNTVVGYEVIESPYNPNFSRSWLFGFGEPFTTTGARASYAFNEYVSFAIGGINSFTGATSDTNNAMSVETALSLTPTDRIGITLFGFWGPEGAVGASNSDRVLGGGIVDVRVTDTTEVIFEALYANQANAPGSVAPAGNSRWNGAAAYLIQDLTDQWSLRIRGEVFEDAGGTQSCFGSLDAPEAGVCFGATGSGTTTVGGATVATVGQPGTATPQTLWETTFTLQYEPVPSVITRLEFRYDKSNKNTFQYGTRSANHQETLSVDVIYLF